MTNQKNKLIISKWKTLALFIIILFILFIYTGMAVFYQSHFFPNTYAGPINIGQQTAEKAQNRLEEQINQQPLTLVEKDTRYGTLDSGQLNIAVDAMEHLSKALAEQNVFAWPLSYFNQQDINIQETLTIDNQVVGQLMSALAINNIERTSTRNATYEHNEAGALVPIQEVFGDEIIEDSLNDALRKSIGQGNLTIDLTDAYVVPRFTLDNQAFQDREAEIRAIIDTDVTLEFDGNVITIPEDLIESWIIIDGAGRPRISQELVKDYIGTLNEQYSGLLRPRQFNSTYQGEVTVMPGTYGWYIDVDEESEQIVQLLESKESITREPIIYGAGYGMGDYIGDSYVEVDLTYQMMFIYHSGELVLETPIVSGQLGAETIPGAYQVWFMEEDSILRDYNPFTEKDYEQPVDYWIAFDNNAQGIHDANWQSAFGGTTYQQYGSLGCINTPPAIMPQVYESVYYGMPVMIFK